MGNLPGNNGRLPAGGCQKPTIPGRRHDRQPQRQAAMGRGGTVCGRSAAGRESAEQVAARTRPSVLPQKPSRRASMRYRRTRPGVLPSAYLTSNPLRLPVGPKASTLGAFPATTSPSNAHSAGFLLYGPARTTCPSPHGPESAGPRHGHREADYSHGSSTTAILSALRPKTSACETPPR